MSFEPLITIAIPTFNRPKYLLRALRSALSQTYQNIEILVSDNANSVTVREIVESQNNPKVRLFSQATNLGMVGNINFLLSEAKGRYINVLSDDDLLDSRMVEQAVSDIQRYPAASIWYCNSKVIDENDHPLHTTYCPPGVQSFETHFVDWISGQAQVTFCSTLYAVELLKNQGGFSDTLMLDTKARVACLRQQPGVCSELHLCSYRVHSSSTTNTSTLEAWFNQEDELVREILEVLSASGIHLERAAERYLIASILSPNHIKTVGHLGYALGLLLDRFGYRIYAHPTTYAFVLKFLLYRRGTLVGDMLRRVRQKVFPKAQSKIKWPY